jgi:hypothetical protein
MRWWETHRRLTLRGVVDAAADGDAAGDELAVALRRAGIGDWRGGKWRLLMRMHHRCRSGG